MLQSSRQDVVAVVIIRALTPVRITVKKHAKEHVMNFARIPVKKDATIIVLIRVILVVKVRVAMIVLVPVWVLCPETPYHNNNLQQRTMLIAVVTVLEDAKTAVVLVAERLVPTIVLQLVKMLVGAIAVANVRHRAKVHAKPLVREAVIKPAIWFAKITALVSVIPPVM